MKKRISLFFLLILSLISQNVWAAYEERYWSARVSSLGGAYESVSDDSLALFYNAAGMIQIQSREVSFSYARLFSGLSGVDLSLNQAAAVQPLGENRRIGMSWGNFNAADLYREDTLVVGYSEDVTPYIDGTKGKFGLGVTGRYLMRKFVLDSRTMADPVFGGGSFRGTPTFDLHLFAKPDGVPFHGFTFGLSLKSINQPDIGFKDQENLPQELVLGTLFQWREAKIPFDISIRKGTIRPHFGTEIKLFNGMISMRAGSDLDQFGGGFGYEKKIGDRYSVGIDYGFLWPLSVETTAGSHRATVSMKF